MNSQGETQDQRKVLVVEDNELLRLALCMQLNRLGVTVDVAADGQEALNLLSTSEYAVVFMDVMLPIVHGLDLAVAIRKKEKVEGREHLPLIGISAVSHDTECKEAGFDEFHLKPVLQDTLIGILERWFSLTPRNNG